MRSIYSNKLDVDGFQKDQEHLIRIWLDKLALIGVILVPLFGIVDYIMYPEYLERFLVYRGIASASCILIYFINRRWNLGIYSSYLAVIGYYIVGFCILKMILDVGGYATPYYAGLNLVFIAFGVLFPLRVKTIALHCIALYLIYVFSVLSLNPSVPFQLDSVLINEISQRDPVAAMYTLFIANNTFVVSSLFIIIIASAVGQNLRFREYLLRQELEEAKQDLQRSNEMLEVTLARKHRDLLENLEEKKLVEQMKDHLEEQLYQSQKMEAIGRLAGGVAHDFNNIMTVIQANSDLILMQMDDDSEQRKRAIEIRKASDRAASLTRQLLAFSRKQTMKPQIMNFNEIVNGMEDLLCRLLGEDIELKTHLEPELGHVKADPTQMEQVLMNLVVNARDAMPKGGVITIRTANVFLDHTHSEQHTELQKGQYVLLTVNDTGEGMDRETQTHIFEPFFTTKDIGKGTGLGLSTVYGIVQQSDGTISVYSEPGKGSTFKVYLPFVQSNEQLFTKPDNAQQLKRGLETILLVEDDDYVRNLASEILKDNGYKLFIASTCSEALSICRTYPKPIDLLLTDVIMPQKSGAELAGEVIEIRPDINVLYMSGYSDDAIAHHGILDEGIVLLEKPFTATTLTNKVREVLDSMSTR